VIGTRKWVIPGLTCLYVVFLAVASLLPSGSNVLGGWDQSITPTMQNALHVPAYAILQGLAMLCAWNSSRAPLLRTVLWIALACCAYGALLECLQALIPGRSGSTVDAVLNAVGVALGTAAAAMIRSGRVWSRPPGSPAGD